MTLKRANVYNYQTQRMLFNNSSYVIRYLLFRLGMLPGKTETTEKHSIFSSSQ